jgi:hypothetical protein
MRSLVICMLLGCGGSDKAVIATAPEPRPAPVDAAAITASSPTLSYPVPLWITRVDSDDALACDRSSTNGLHGVILVSDGTALFGAGVVVTDLTGKRYRATIDRTGCYFIADLPAESVAVDVKYDWASNHSRVTVPSRGLVRLDGKLEIE